MSKSTRSGPIDKPAKPYPDFPLFAHATRRWAKKIRGKFHYFGPWHDPEGALQRYLNERDDLYAGRNPRARAGLSLKQLINEFLTEKQRAVDAGELHARTWKSYYDTCARLINCLGQDAVVRELGPDDFAKLRFDLAKTMGPQTLRAELTRIRVLFKWAYESDRLENPVKYGPAFKSPSKRALLQAKQAKGKQTFEAHEIWQLIDAAAAPLRAMILLAVNTGAGNNDLGTLSSASFDLEGGWFNHPRPKTGTPRHVPLWPETVKALREAIATRPKPAKLEHSDLVFLTPRGKPVTGVTEKARWRNAVWARFNALVKKLGLRPRGFYALRHTFETIGGESRDQIAVDACMGHVTPGMGTVYRERISDERLRRVTDHVREWLFADQPVSIPIERQVS